MMVSTRYSGSSTDQLTIEIGDEQSPFRVPGEGDRDHHAHIADLIPALEAGPDPLTIGKKHWLNLVSVSQLSPL